MRRLHWKNWLVILIAVLIEVAMFVYLYWFVSGMRIKGL
jgi:hypothetical protein